jgi:phospholipase C
LANVLRQLENGNANFVGDYAQAYPATTPDQRQRIMNYFPLGTLPILHALAKQSLVCDQWFSSVPGPTWANRFFVHSGTSKGWVHMPEGLPDFWRHRADFTYYDQPTIYDRLSEQKIPWCIYFNDVPQSLVLTSLRRLDYADNFQTLDRFLIDASGEEGEFPAYAFIEPDYFWPGQNDDHPPHSTRKAQELIKTVYLALKGNQPLWESTLLVIVYDEHGGFFDHVSPGRATPPDAHHEEYTFDRLGVRVPALLVSPWVDPGVDSTLYDHTSILRYVSEKWGLGKLTDRVGSTASIGTLIRTTGAPRPIPEMDEMKVVYGLQEQADEVAAAEPLNANQAALYALTEFLEMERGRKTKRSWMRGS